MNAHASHSPSRPPQRPSSIPPPNNAGARAIGKRPRMSNFLRLLVTITAVAHTPFVVGLAEALRRVGFDSPIRFGIAGVLALVGTWLFVGRAKHVMNDAARPAWETFAVDLPYYSHWSACIYCLIPSLVYVIFAPIVDAVRGTPVVLEPGFFMWTYASGLVVCTYGVTFRRWWFVTRTVEIPVRGLDNTLDGYTIAHLSDLHIGALTPPWWARRWVRASNAAKPDAVAITGDLVTSGTAFHDDIAKVVGELEARDGVFVSMGNHDYFGEGEPLISLLRDHGAKVLRNEGEVITKDGGKFFLTAIDDTWTKRADLDRALAARPDGMATVLLAHDPDRFPQAVKKDVDVVLSGHTHGGQIAVPFFGRYINASKLAHHFHIGVYEDGDSTLYVHPGLGTTGPPIRLGVAPAVVLIKLRAV